MIIISDTSIIINLARVEHLHLLPQLFQEVVIPKAVFQEVVIEGNGQPGATEIAEADWIEVIACQNQSFIQTLLDEIDLGEAEAIGLALEQTDEALLLLDERRGRSVADRFLLTHIGILGILLEAKSEGYIATVQPIMDRLIQEARFYISDSLYQQVLVLAGEEKSI